MLKVVEDPKEIVRRGYDRISRAYRADDAHEGEYAAWLDLVEAKLAAGADVLDLGCGCGIPVARRLSRRYAVTGVDLSPVQVERARELVPGARFICADMSAVEFPPASFDAVVCLYAIIHLPLGEQPATLRAIATWLRPGGIFVATVGHRAWTGMEKDWLGVAGGDMWWSHADASTYRHWLTDAGLTVELETFVPEGAGATRSSFARARRAARVDPWHRRARVSPRPLRATDRTKRVPRPRRALTLRPRG